VVSSISYEGQGTNSTYYSYDLSGNVKTLYQKVSGIDQKRIDYDYDLISGKVNMVAYQHEQADRFYYEYDYDTENRLTRVYSSRNGVYKSDGRGSYLINKERDARYHYYLHGPLARIEYAKPIVQGVDYAYTLQGWLKGINSSSLGQSKDIGKDGLDNTIPEDVLSYSLDYYQGDYQSLGNTAGQPFSQASSSKQGASLYNGNIRGMGVNNKALGNPYYNSYRYDQLNRLKQVRPYTGLNTSSNSWEFQEGLGAYQENFSYDANGNIQKLNRTGTSSTRVDSLIYSYPEVGGQKQNNRLRHVKDLATSTGPDIGNQIDDNYAYDAIGNLTSDQQSGLNTISWNVYGKIKSIDKAGTAADISYAYDAAGNRVKKTVGTTQTYYIRDAQGNTLAVYKQEGSNALQLEEQQLYGSSRLGVWKAGSELTEASLKEAWQSAHKRGYELSNHLGNVLSVISGEYVLNSLGVKEAVVLSAQDYYAFGSTMPERSYSAAGSGYRYGFNGKENDNEVKGEGNSIDLGERMYDPRIGRTLSTDNKEAKYPNISPYAYAANNPIYYIDPDGNDVEVYVTIVKVGTTKINLYSASEIKKDASLANKTRLVAVYEVKIKNESGSSATFYFTRVGYRGQTDGTEKEVTFDVRNDKDEFLGKIKSRWGGTDNVLELRDKDNINDQSVEGMKGEVDAVRTAIQFHVKGATDGCLLCVGKAQITKDKGATVDETDLKSNSGDTQRAFMKKIKEFQKEDKDAGKGDAIKIKFDKLNGSASNKKEKKK
jgi:RHS repeat-associated protein